jgi:hypothetical protein
MAGGRSPYLGWAKVCSLDERWVGKATSLRDCGNIVFDKFLEQGKARFPASPQRPTPASGASSASPDDRLQRPATSDVPSNNATPR